MRGLERENQLLDQSAGFVIVTHVLYGRLASSHAVVVVLATITNAPFHSRATLFRCYILYTTQNELTVPRTALDIHRNQFFGRFKSLYNPHT